MSPSERRTLAIAAVAFAVMCAFVAARFQVSTDILAFLPSSDDRVRAELSRNIAASELSRTMIVTVGAEDRAAAAQASRVLEANLRAEPRVAAGAAFIEGGPPEGIEEEVWGIYHPRRFGFVAETAEEAAAMTSETGLNEAAAELRRRLESPMSTLVTRVAPGDPLLALPRLFERLESGRGTGLVVESGRFLSGTSPHAVLFVGTSASAFDSGAQMPFLDGFAAAVDATRNELGAGVEVEVSGINRFAVRAETAIKADIRRVSVLSTLGLGLLLVLLFRSVRLVLVAAAPVGTGVIAGCAATLLVFGRIHGVTLAFGASLIGVALDYVVHIYCHHALGSAAPTKVARDIRSALWTGAGTTVVGFVALGTSRFPGLREVAVFAVTGVVVAVAMTRWVVPILLPAQQADVQLRSMLVRALTGGLRFLRSQRRAILALTTLVAVLASVGLWNVRWNSDFGSMAQLDPDLVLEDTRVRERMGALEQSRFVVALGADEEEALQGNDGVRRILDAAVEAGELGGYRGVGALVPSARRQAEVAGVLFDDDGLWERFAAAFDAAGYRSAAFDEFRQALESERPTPVTFAELRDSKLAPMVRPFLLHVGDEIAVVSFLEDVRDSDALAARFDGAGGAVYVDQGALMSSANAAYQRGTARALLLGLGAVLIVLGLRYRDPRRVAASFVPSVLAAATTVAVLGVFGIGLDLVALTALLMVVSMGVDYGVFLVDAADRDEHDVGAALLSILVACMTTVFGFGTLALSQHPVLHSIGLTAAVGVLSCFFLAPASLVLLRPSAR